MFRRRGFTFACPSISNIFFICLPLSNNLLTNVDLKACPFNYNKLFAYIGKWPTLEKLLTKKLLAMYNTSYFPKGLVIFILIMAVVLIISLWKVFEKAGRPGWEAIIPIYNYYILTKIIGKPGWWTIMMLIPYVNFVFIIWANNMLSKSFGKMEGFTAGLVLLPYVFFPILGFGDAKYLGPYGNKAAFDEYGNKNRFDFEEQITS